MKRLLVICPAFVADCLETIEEIGLRGCETFINAGGQYFARVPCLNEHRRWVDALENMVVRWRKEATADGFRRDVETRRPAACGTAV